jgi:hypothetical protein
MPQSVELCHRQGCGYFTQWLGSYRQDRKPLFSSYCRVHYSVSTLQQGAPDKANNKS